MSLTIWKYPLAITDRQIIMVPYGAGTLTVQAQGDSLCLWALVNPDAPKKPRVIEILGTGNPAPEAHRCYISTVQTHNRALVWHIFEII